MSWIPCPYLAHLVELTEEREGHILEEHPDLLPRYWGQLLRTVADPDEVRKDARYGATRLFSRWFDEVEGGKFIVVAIMSQPPPAKRDWVLTAYIARRLGRRVIEWKRG